MHCDCSSTESISSLIGQSTMEKKTNNWLQQPDGEHVSRINRVPRVIRDGKVAVIYQPHHGLGWFSEHRTEALLFDPDIVGLIERNASGSLIYEHCQKMKYGWSVMDTICYGLRYIPNVI